LYSFISKTGLDGFDLLRLDERLVSLDIYYYIKVLTGFLIRFKTTVCSAFVLVGSHYDIPSESQDRFFNSFIIGGDTNFVD
jgi:hypothetical protein